MRVFTDLQSLPAFREAVITIGSFDGVHLGHQAIFEKLRRLALNTGGESVVITFHPHPRQVIYPQDEPIKLLSTPEEKIRLIASCGIDNLVIVPFTIEFSQLNADEYIHNFIVEKFHPRCIVIGYDHRFGLNRQGDVSFLRWHGEAAGYEVVEIGAREADEITVSSTKIRNCIKSGDVAGANKLLGRPYALTGKVVHGEQIGTRLGFPTANVEPDAGNKLIPSDGIYAVRVHLGDESFDGMLYIGNRPSVPGKGEQRIEVNIFKFNRDIYGWDIRIEFVGFIRHDARMENLDRLKMQLTRDREQVQALLARVESEESKKKAGRSDLAVVILNYNGRAWLEKFLPGVIRDSGEKAVVYVADNASSDDSLSWLSDHFPAIRQVPLKKNYGFAEGYNRALDRIDADYYVLLNSDVETTPGWLDPAVQMMENDRLIAAVQPKILDYNRRDRFEYAGAAGGWIDFLGYPFCRGRIFAETETDAGQYDEPEEIFWASGAALFIRADLFHRIGGFDANYFAHAEEIDLCWRLKRAGFKVMAEPRSVVFHVGGGTLAYETPRKAYLNFRNTLFTSFKNEPLPKLLWLLPVRLLLDGVAGLLFLSQGKFAHIISIFRAHGSFYRQLAKTWRKRRENAGLIANLSGGRPMNRCGILPGSIVWRYYARGKRRFRQVVKP